jgi:PST family polysaccharide transporter
MQSSERPYEHLFETDTVRANLKTNSVRGGLYTFASQGGNLLLNIASTAVLARVLFPADFGLLGMVLALTAIAERFKDVGLSTATVQKKEITHEEVSKLFWLNTLVGFLISLALVLLSGIVARFYRDQRLTALTIAVSSTFVFSGLTIQHQALLNRQMRFGALALINFGSQVLSSILAIVLALKGFSYWSLVWREISRSIISAIATWVLCPWVPGLPDRKTDASRLITFGRDITLFNLVTYTTRSLDQVLLGRFGGAMALGLFRQAFQLIMVPVNQVTGPVQAVAEPAFSALQGNIARYRKGFEKVVTTLGVISMPIAAGVFVCSKYIVMLLLGPKWAGAIPILRILAVAVFVRPVVSTMGFVMVTCGKTGRYAMIGLVDSLVLSAAVSIGVVWGRIGVALGHVAATYAVFLPLLWWALKGTPVDVKLWFRAVMRPTVASVIMAVIVYFLSSVVSVASAIRALCSLVPVGMVTYFVILMMLPGNSMLRELLSDFSFAAKKRRNPFVATATVQ